jgi:hypothetical protein
MTTSTSAAAGRIFISYRREDTAYPAGWLFDRLVEHFGQGQVFKDVDSIPLGDDFVEVITAAVAHCAVLLALIGDQWLTITGEDGRRRLDDPGDFVRLEIEAALTRDVRVIPVLVGGAQMPRPADLPPSLAKLVNRQALELSPIRFAYDTGRLLKVLDSSPPGAQPLQPDTVRNDRPRATRLLDEAVRIAPAISDKSSQARALADVAEKLAATDPGRATRLFADAERIAQTIPDESPQARALADIAGKLAATDPDRAERIAQTITDKYWNVCALVRIAEAITKA